VGAIVGGLAGFFGSMLGDVIAGREVNLGKAVTMGIVGAATGALAGWLQVDGTNALAAKMTGSLLSIGFSGVFTRLYNQQRRRRNWLRE